MSYEEQNSLNDLDVATPLDGATPQELLEAFRQLKAVVKNALLTSHYPDGRLRQGSYSSLDENSVGAAQVADGAISLSKMADGSVGLAQLVDLSVTEAKLGDGSVVESKYGAASIPATAFKSNTIPLAALGDFISRAYLSSHVSNDALRAVTANAIADGAVTDRTVTDVGVGKLTGGADQNMLIKLAGVWTPVAITGDLVYDSLLNTFVVQSGVKVAVVADTKARGSDGGNAGSNTWNIRTLGEMTDDDNLITFSANKFKLIAGKYFFYVMCPAYDVGAHQARLFDVTGSTVVVWGSTESAAATANDTTKSVIMGFFEVTDPENEYQIEHWIQSSVGSTDLGKASSSDNSTPYASHSEVYTQGFIIKVG